jgi:hypothetical protein
MSDTSEESRSGSIGHKRCTECGNRILDLTGFESCNECGGAWA